MGTKILSLTCQVKRGKQEAFERKNPVLASGEPVVVWCKDGTTKLKFGNGRSKYKDLPFMNEDNIVSKPTKDQFPAEGKAGVIYKSEKEAKLYQWNSETHDYESLNAIGSDIKDEIIYDVTNMINELNNKLDNIVFDGGEIV